MRSHPVLWLVAGKVGVLDGGVNLKPVDQVGTFGLAPPDV